MKKLMVLLLSGLLVFGLSSCGLVSTTVMLSAVTSSEPEYTNLETLEKFCSDPERYFDKKVCLRGYVASEPKYVNADDCTVFVFVCQAGEEGEEFEKRVMIIYSGDNAEGMSKYLEYGSTCSLNGSVYGATDGETPEAIFDITDIFDLY